MRILKRIALATIAMLWGALHAQALVWPTPHPAAIRGESFESWAQATASGEPTSALFGCVRNNGNRFHEGIDITPYQPRDRRGEATDPIYAALDGIVVYINTTAGNSSYGRYVVIEHPEQVPAVYTLYAHLGSVQSDLKVGQAVSAGETIGVMGRSAGGYTIPRERAHLHWEIGLRLSDRFQVWYDRQGFGSRNQHGNFNGMNFVGYDPLEAFNWMRSRPGSSLGEYFASLPPGVILDVVTTKTPGLLQRYPGLLKGGQIPDDLAGWRVTLTGYGLPLSFEPLRTAPEGSRQGHATIVAIDPDQLDLYHCRNIVRRQSENRATLGNGSRRILELIFDFE